MNGKWKSPSRLTLLGSQLCSFAAAAEVGASFFDPLGRWRKKNVAGNAVSHPNRENYELDGLC